MGTKMRGLSSGALLLFCCIVVVVQVQSADLSEKEFEKASQEIRRAFETHATFVRVPLLPNELLCRCTESDCDKEIVDIAGPDYGGICRAHVGGVCRKIVQYTEDGQINDAVLSCVLAHELIPPERPFICQTVRSTKVDCCTNASFCNYMDMHFPPPNTSIHWYILLLLIVAVFFSALGLLIGIFWCSSDRSKRFCRNLMARLTGKRSSQQEHFLPDRREYTVGYP